jgi:hypothetical protein
MNFTIQKRNLAWVALCVLATCSVSAAQQAVTISNQQLSVTAGLAGGAYQIAKPGMKRSVLQSGVAAEIGHAWVKSAGYPHAKTVQSTFTDSLGKGQMLTITYQGLAERPTLICILRLYDDLPFGDVRVSVQNSTGKNLTVQAIRSVEAVGSPRLDLGGREDAARVLSDSFSEDRPPVRIYDLGKAPVYLDWDEFAKEYSDTHLAVGSQLIYNRESHQSLFLGALTSERWLTVLRLGVAKSASGAVRVVSYTVDSTGTTEMEKRESLHDVPAENQIELSLSLPPGQELASERLLFSTGQDYINQLQVYGDAVRRLHQARVTSEAPSGWWSWIPYYAGVTGGLVLTNAQALSEQLRSYGYRYVLIDEGYQYARGEYATPNAVQFPDGMINLSRQVSDLGLKFGVWTAPFEVSERAWVYQNHPEWLVRNAAGKPLSILQPDVEPLYVLDATHPGAQEYLRQTYRTMAREWGLRYVKLDFMDDTSVEGYYYQPGTTALQAQRIGLQVIREALGEDVLIDKDGSTMLNPVGFVDEGRISLDTAHSFAVSKSLAPGIAARFYMHRNFFISDPDAFSVLNQSPPGSNLGKPTPALTLNEAEVAIAVAAVSGGMFELGDDLTLLGTDPERLALVQNPYLLEMYKLNRASLPVDLMSYAAEDELPSVFVLHEDAHQNILTVFNWTDSPRSHSVSWNDLRLPAGHQFKAWDLLHPGTPVTISGQALGWSDQPPHSVRLIRIVDTGVAAAAPTLAINAPSSVQVAKAFTLSASCDPAGVPVLSYHWDFGDGTTADGLRATHTYTRTGTFSIKVTAQGVDGLPANGTISVGVTGTLDPQFHFTENQRYVEPAGH